MCKIRTFRSFSEGLFDANNSRPVLPRRSRDVGNRASVYQLKLRDSENASECVWETAEQLLRRPRVIPELLKISLDIYWPSCTLFSFVSLDPAVCGRPTYPHPPGGILIFPLSGIFTLRNSEYQEGTSQLFPEEWDAYIAPIPEVERGWPRQDYTSIRDLFNVLKRTIGQCKGFVSSPGSDPSSSQAMDCGFFTAPNHCFINEGFMRQWQLLEKQSIDTMRVYCEQITVENGDAGSFLMKGDMVVCPVKSAYDLKKAWPEITLHFTHAGHSAHEPETEKLLVEGRLAFP
ncbi:hypothetical protein BS47DRAFT_1400340 [Hydnum rufescens UP504]|uniref:Uncharacterized protein n=1 Tax=Hydnum rufescens UP504 TaxID=1448309 RepID=A0A9P6AH97_9AGAM|nr:hypothetical protein BS47DRAFT_1400340 [Hydnum rufescens UP504]